MDSSRKFYDPNASKVSRDDYEEEFKPSVFLNYYKAETATAISPFIKHRVQCFHESFQTVPRGVKVLDYGSGPVILCCISAAAKASEIVLADYTENNRKCLRQWLNSEPDAFDWSPHFNYIVQDLEGKGENEARNREDQFKKISKNVVHCDITQNPPIENGFDVLYDVVICCLVLEASASIQDEYYECLKRLATLIKPGGSIFYYGAENRAGYYTVGDRSFPTVCVSEQMALEAFKNAGFSDITINRAPEFEPDKSFRFIRGTRL